MRLRQGSNVTESLQVAALLLRQQIETSVSSKENRRYQDNVTVSWLHNALCMDTVNKTVAGLDDVDHVKMY